MLQPIIFSHQTFYKIQYLLFGELLTLFLVTKKQNVIKSSLIQYDKKEMKQPQST